MDVRTWAPLLEDARPGSHLALVYRDEEFLSRAVAVWSAPTLRAGGGAVLVGTATHAFTIRGRLQREGLDVDALERSGRLVILDADWLMGRFIIDGTPSAAAFRSLADEILNGVRAASAGDVRAWGEMVSLLRLRGSPGVARKLEEMWTEIIAAHGISLLCSYDLVARTGTDADFMTSVAHEHSHVLLQPEPPAGGVAVDAR